jgi:hypothetical protein
MNRVKWLHVSLLLLLALGLAMPAVAQVNGPRELYNSEVPGSVIVFPKFINGTTTSGEARSEFEISVNCPDKDPITGFCRLAEGTKVKLRAHWVCPADQKVNTKFICKETDFDLNTTVYGTIIFSPSNTGVTGAFPTAPLSVPPGGVTRVPTPPCEHGYLIAWVIDNNDRPIKYDALIGDAVLRDVNGGTSAYNGIPIQAVSTLPHGAPIPGGFLVFNGTTSYKAVAGAVTSSVRFGVEPPANATTYTSVRTDLTLLTLDVLSNRSNFPTFVDLDFYNANEYLLSTYWEFICWTEVSLFDINPNLTEAGMFTRKGLVVSGPAEKFEYVGIDDKDGFVTLLGLVETTVTSVSAAGSTSQAYSYSVYHDGKPVPTKFQDNDVR